MLNSEERLKAADVVLVLRSFSTKTPFFSYRFHSRSGPLPEAGERIVRNLVLYRDWGFSPSSAEAWPLKCLCILVLTFLRATAPNKKNCQVLPEIEFDDSSRVV